MVYIGYTYVYIHAYIYRNHLSRTNIHIFAWIPIAAGSAPIQSLYVHIPRRETWQRFPCPRNHTTAVPHRIRNAMDVSSRRGLTKSVPGAGGRANAAAYLSSSYLSSSGLFIKELVWGGVHRWVLPPEYNALWNKPHKVMFNDVNVTIGGAKPLASTARSTPLHPSPPLHTHIHMSQICTKCSPAEAFFLRPSHWNARGTSQAGLAWTVLYPSRSILRRRTYSGSFKLYQQCMSHIFRGGMRLQHARGLSKMTSCAESAPQLLRCATAGPPPQRPTQTLAAILGALRSTAE